MVWEGEIEWRCWICISFRMKRDVKDRRIELLRR